MNILFGLIILLLLAAFTLVFPQTKKEFQESIVTKEPPAREEENITDAIAEKKPLSISLSPPSVIQGEPVLVTAEGITDRSHVESFTFDGKSIPVFEHEGKLAAFLSIDLHKKPSSYEVALLSKDGEKATVSLEVKERILPVSDFDIPESFGGNTVAGEQKLTSNLESDTKTLNAVTALVSPEKLWTEAFRPPLDGNPVVTDTYGYSRQTGATNISHNGTDFRAAVGTPVYAMNTGQVAFAGTFRNYGHTVIIDHGQGLMTMYMHLSELKVETGTPVEKDDLIALSGNTGYSLGPHLHLSVRIYGSSLDPIEFLELMGPK